jgi:hypothetical protein
MSGVAGALVRKAQEKILGWATLTLVKEDGGGCPGPRGRSEESRKGCKCCGVKRH